ncbi:hypothetical protein OKA04_20665 [Luteolibacter flavescens]|uniref:Uncharacterized protein n=1 Tax=Luteolibacter flavescens TaxID=1859460 RepID=A0ABT3FVC1_9BACT|nr:hypothetical protein [Luteolibacter flavescens]MCW1887164.1 hypothetical protein [Luteolibacter flavescens]
MSKRQVILLVGILAVAGAPFLLPFFMPWSSVNCRDVEIDVNSGKKRESRYLYGIRVGREVSGTLLSAEVADEGKPERWVMVNRFGPYLGHSPHYLFHSALHQVQQLALIWDIGDFDAAGRQSSGRGLLREWQATGSDASADGYLRRLFESTRETGDL